MATTPRCSSPTVPCSPPARWSPRPVASPNPYLPYILGREEYEGRLLHVAAYRSPSGFEGQRIVVVGAGNSAVQVAHEMAAVADVSLASRDPIPLRKQRPLGVDLHYWLHGLASSLGSSRCSADRRRVRNPARVGPDARRVVDRLVRRLPATPRWSRALVGERHGHQPPCPSDTVFSGAEVRAVPAAPVEPTSNVFTRLWRVACPHRRRWSLPTPSRCGPAGLGWAGVYAVRPLTELSLYAADRPELLGWPRPA